MGEQTNRKAYRILSKKERVRFIKMMTKSTFDYRKYVKCEEDWWDLTNFVLLYDYRSTKMGTNFRAIVGNESIKEVGPDLDDDIEELFFSNVREEWAHRNLWPQGRRQSFTYKINRISENINSFLGTELREPDGRSWQKPLRLQYDVQSIYSARTRYYGDGHDSYNGGIGIVDAYNQEEARLQFEMFVFPMVGYIPMNKSADAAVFEWEGYCPTDNKTELYVFHNGRLIEKKLNEINTLEEQIANISKRINVSQLIIDSARSNLLANMGVEN